MIEVGLEGFPIPSRAGGIGAYVRGLAGALARERDVRLTILVPFKAREMLRRLAGRLEHEERLDIHGSRASLEQHETIRFRYDLSHVLCRWIDGVLPPLDAAFRGLDVIHGSAFYLPPTRRIPSVATFHDLAFLRHPGTGTPGLRLDREHVERWARRARRVIAVSEATARDVRELLRVPEAKVVTIHNGFDPHPFMEGSAREDAAALSRLGITRPYLLHVGTVEPRKNHATLLSVLDLLEASRPDLTLVLAGRRGWRAGAEVAAIERAQERGRARWLGPLGLDVVSSLYRCAEALVFPSLYEGFGFPLLEAMAASTPVVCSRNSSLEEVGGDAPLYVDDARDAPAFRAAVERILDDADLRDLHVARGLENVRRFSWERAARRTAEVYREVAG